MIQAVTTHNNDIKDTDAMSWFNKFWRRNDKLMNQFNLIDVTLASH